MTIEQTIDRVSEFLRLWKTGRHNGDVIHAYNMAELLVSDIEQLIALSTLTPGSRLPGGLVVVPMEPTEAMICASGCECGLDRSDAADHEEYVKADYRAMLSALEGSDD